MKFRFVIIGLLISVLLGCSARIEDYQSTEPALNLEEFFNGKLTAWGVFTDRSNLVKRRFKVSMVGTWKDGVGILDEDFYYDDGKVEKRIWTLTKVSENEYTGIAGDVVGTAIGRTEGYALNWTYSLNLPVGDDVYELNFDDWMYLIDEKSLINIAEVTKFGFKVGEVTLFIQKE